MKFAAVPYPAPRLVAIILLAVSAAAGAGSVMAQGHAPARDQAERNDHQRHADHRALSDAVRRVERATGGEVLSAERVQSDGRDVSRVKVVDASGRVRVYMGDRPPRERKEDRTRRDDSNKD